MKIKFKYPSPRAGEISHEKPQVAEMLIAAGLAEAIPYANFRERLAAESPKPATGVPLVQWSVARSTQRIGNPVYISARCSNPNCSTVYFDASPVAMSSALHSLTFIHSCSAAVPEKVPSSIIDKYVGLWHLPATLSPSDAVAARMAAPQEQTRVDLSKIVGPRMGDVSVPFTAPNPDANWLPASDTGHKPEHLYRYPVKEGK